MASFEWKLRNYKKKGKATTIKVVHTSRNQDGSPGEHTTQCFFTLTEDLANVPTVTRLMRDHFESSSLVLCSTNGLAISDTSATTGMSLGIFACTLSIFKQLSIACRSKLLESWK